MFGIGMPEMIMILAIALIVIGPKKLPDLAKTLGRALGEFRKATRDFKESLEVDEDFKELKDVKKAFQDMNQNTKEPEPAPSESAPKTEPPPADAAADVKPKATEKETEEAPKDGQSTE